MTIDPAKLAKLPVWAQDYINNLQRERVVAIRALNDYCDSQKPSEIYCEEYESTGENQGPSLKRAYVQSSKITIEHAGIKLNVYANEADCIRLQWGSSERGLLDVAMIPYSCMSVLLVAKENMR